MKALLLGLAISSMVATTATAEGMDDLVHQKLGTMLKDPASAVVKLVRPLRATGFRAYTGDIIGGWAACYTVNAKNSFGGYTGAKDYLFVTDGARIIYAAAGEDRLASIDVVKECRHAADAPASEGVSIAEANAAPTGTAPFLATPVPAKADL